MVGPGAEVADGYRALSSVGARETSLGLEGQPER